MSTVGRGIAICRSCSSAPPFITQYSAAMQLLPDEWKVNAASSCAANTSSLRAFRIILLLYKLICGHVCAGWQARAPIFFLLCSECAMPEKNRATNAQTHVCHRFIHRIAFNAGSCQVWRSACIAFQSACCMRLARERVSANNECIRIDAHC